jgi:hypothetical protein
MDWFETIKVGEERIAYRGIGPDNECCRQMRERIRTDRLCVRLGMPEMIETMECEELRVFLDDLALKKSVRIPDGRTITFRHNRDITEHIIDLVDIFDECLYGARKVEYVPGQSDSTFREKYT